MNGHNISHDPGGEDGRGFGLTVAPLHKSHPERKPSRFPLSPGHGSHLLRRFFFLLAAGRDSDDDIRKSKEIISFSFSFLSLNGTQIYADERR